LWLAVVVGDLSWRGQLGAVWRFDLYSFFFLLEFALLGFGSLILFSNQNRHSPRWLFVSAALIVLGGALYRFNVYLIGFNPGQGWSYFPSLAEVMISVGIVAIELLGYQVLVKTVPVLPRIGLHRHPHARPLCIPAAPSIS
jgi:Ni/Fe-hydrogenase subunit HybB-like protein